MKVVTPLLASKVSDLKFVEIVDELQHNWVIWGVDFTFDGKEYYGSLEACNVDPEGFHADEIWGIELIENNP